MWSARLFCVPYSGLGGRPPIPLGHAWSSTTGRHSRPAQLLPSLSGVRACPAVSGVPLTLQCSPRGARVIPFFCRHASLHKGRILRPERDPSCCLSRAVTLPRSSVRFIPVRGAGPLLRFSYAVQGALPFSARCGFACRRCFHLTEPGFTCCLPLDPPSCRETPPCGSNRSFLPVWFCCFLCDRRTPRGFPPLLRCFWARVGDQDFCL
ncbi:hypothetical protein NDU88_001455 [Pleurodeles waltl]|uniref:Uncharacterized protein n=1 Tax=Pleurodeles waltl TaxID=8319 RepID=A0AAV7THW0_PLEWA|nr:hypothetical protein NDU88_001455 [Pleurodeles waltl]